LQIVIDQYTASCATGLGLDALSRALADRVSGLRRNDFEGCDIASWIGRVADVEKYELPESLHYLESRNNRLAWAGLQQDRFLESVETMVERVGARRVGVVLGTSTSSIGQTEMAYRQLDPDGDMKPEFRQPQVHNLHSPGIFVSRVTGVRGPSLTISTACSSSAKVFATAARWIRAGVVDAVIAGGVDSLCLSVLYGFNSLELVSEQPCRPFDVNRDGINIGEAAGFALLTRKDLAEEATLSLLGYGESCDAYHMSHPHPDGKGAVLAMQRALHHAGISAAQVDYVNLHGTASQANDQIEARAMAQVFDGKTLASSTKGWTGHCLGAAGIIEAIIAMESTRTGQVPGTLNCTNPDTDFEYDILLENHRGPVDIAMTNSFGFGGNNCSLLFAGAREGGGQ